MITAMIIILLFDVKLKFFGYIWLVLVSLPPESAYLPRESLITAQFFQLHTWNIMDKGCRMSVFLFESLSVFLKEKKTTV